MSLDVLDTNVITEAPILALAMATRAAFLRNIEADIKAHTERLRAFNGGLYDRLKALVGDVDVDLGELLSPDDE